MDKRGGAQTGKGTVVLSDLLTGRIRTESGRIWGSAPAAGKSTVLEDGEGLKKN